MMKKVLFGLFTALICLPMAIGQNKVDLVVRTVDTVVCGSLTWNGTLYTSDTVLFFLSGDTATVLNVTVDTGSVSTNETVTACGHYDAPWGETLTVGGSYLKDTVINGCERHDTLELSINPVYTAATEQFTAECSYLWYDSVITDNAVHSHTLTTVDGCDSVVSIQVTTFTHQTTVYDTVENCGSVIVGWGDTIDASGDYTNVVTDSLGCQTTTHLHLTVNGVYTDTANVVVEQVQGGCNYVWQGQTFTDTNETHYATVATAAGCDSIIAISITGYTNHSYDTNNVRYCGKRYTGWYGRTFDNPDTVYNRTWTGTTFSADTVMAPANGCTVHHHLNLTFVNNYDTLNTRGCEELVYTFAARAGVAGRRDTARFYESGEYDQDLDGNDIYSRAWNTGCYTIHHLNVTVIVPEQRLRPDTMNVSECDSYTFRYRNDTPKVFTSDTAFTYVYDFHDLSNGVCHDSTINVNIVIRHSSRRDTTVVTCDTFTWNFNGMMYTGSGQYEEVISGVRNSQGCDSLGHLNLTVNHTPTVSIEGNWILLPGETANLSANCVEPNVDFKWYTGTSTTPVSTTATYSVTPQNGENVDVHLVTTRTYAGNNTCVANNWVTVTSNVGIDDVESLQVSLYPNPASRVLNVKSAAGVGEVVIFNTLGQKVLDQQGSSERMQLDLGSLSTGSYIVRITGMDGETATRKINVSK